MTIVVVAGNGNFKIGKLNWDLKSSGESTQDENPGNSNTQARARHYGAYLCPQHFGGWREGVSVEKVFCARHGRFNCQ